MCRYDLGLVNDGQVSPARSLPRAWWPTSAASLMMMRPCDFSMKRAVLEAYKEARTIAISPRVAIRWRACQCGISGAAGSSIWAIRFFHPQLAFFQPLQRQLIPGAFVRPAPEWRRSKSRCRGRKTSSSTRRTSSVLHRQIGGGIIRLA